MAITAQEVDIDSLQDIPKAQISHDLTPKGYTFQVRSHTQHDAAG